MLTTHFTGCPIPRTSRSLAAALVFLALAAPVAVGVAAADDKSTVEYIAVESAALKRTVSVGVYLPPGYAESKDARFPALYFLHGLFGNERKWQDRGTPGHVDQLIAAKDIEPMIVVCPDGDNSFYMKWVDGTEDWEAFIVKDLVAAIDAKYRTLAERGKRGLTGDSMGGFGALNLGLRNPDVFGSISAHSAALLPEDPGAVPDWMQRFGKRVTQIFGNPPDAEHWKANNPIHLARSQDEKALKSLAIYFDCGEADRYGFDVGATALHEALLKRSVPHDFHIRAGNHGKDYYLKYVDFSLRFHAAAFQGKQPAAPADPANGKGGKGGDQDADKAEGTDAKQGDVKNEKREI